MNGANKPWLAGGTVWVIVPRSAAPWEPGGTMFRVAHVRHESLSEAQLQLLYESWVTLRRTLKREEVDLILLDAAMGGG